MKQFEEWFKERKKQHTEISFQETFQAGYEAAMKEVESIKYHLEDMRKIVFKDYDKCK